MTGLALWRRNARRIGLSLAVAVGSSLWLVPLQTRALSEDVWVVAPELDQSGEWLTKFGRTEEALPYYREALRRNPADSRVNTEMGFLALKQGKWTEALQHLETALQHDSDNSRIYFGKGLAYSGLGRFDEGRQAFETVTRIDPEAAPAYYNAGIAYSQMGWFEDAVKAQKNVIRLTPDFAPAYFAMGEALYRLGREPEGIGAYKEAIHADPDFAPAHYAMGSAMLQAGDMILHGAPAEKERAGDLAQHSDRVVHRQFTLTLEPRAQRLTFDERHGEIRQPGAAAGREHRHDVRMLEPRREHDLAFEPLDRDAGGHLRRQHLHDDLALQRMLFGHEHARHSAAAELALERVGAAEYGLELFAKIGHAAG